MPFRLDPERYGEFRGKIQFTTSAQMPSLIYKACLATGCPSNTVYIQYAVCEALARDLDLPLEDLIASLPTPRTTSKHLMKPKDAIIGPASYHEDVRPRAE